MLAAAVTSHIFWITSRAFGIVALILSSAAVGVGVSISGRLTRQRSSDLRTIHEALSLATIAAVVLHAASLLGDGYFHPALLPDVLAHHALTGAAMAERILDALCRKEAHV